MSYRTSIRLSDENRRFLRRFQVEAREAVGRHVPVSELVDTIVTRYREEVESLEPTVQARRHEGLSLQGRGPDREDRWMQAAAEILVRSGLL